MHSKKAKELLIKAKARFEKGDVDQAEALCKKIIRSNPGMYSANLLLGQIAKQKGDYPRAISCLSIALEKKEDLLLRGERGICLLASKNLESALIDLEMALQVKECPPSVKYALGQIHYYKKEYKQAIAYLQNAFDAGFEVEKIPRILASSYDNNGEHQKAAYYYSKAMLADPKDVDSIFLLAHTCGKMERWAEARTLAHKVLELSSRFKEQTLNLIGGANYSLGDIDEAIDAFQEIERIKPTSWDNHCASLISMHYVTKYSPSVIFHEHLKWAKRYDQQPSATNYSLISSELSRKLRIGYISPDFRNHPVAYFILPVLQNCNSEMFESFCYSNVAKPTPITQEIIKIPGVQWRDIRGKDGDVASQMIADDQIDILVDLAGHTADSRLDVMARKPAPVQVTYLGYPDTTGLSQIDYRITDNFADPVGKTEHLHTERLVRMERCFLCFQAPAECLEQAVMPYRENGYITFGSFNKITKISNHTIVLWANILKKIPDSRLILKSRGLNGGIADNLLSKFERQGIERERISILPFSQSHALHFLDYAKMDIALDPYPYNGTTTSFEAMWMGRPLVSRAGENHVSRVGASLLSTSGMTQLVVENDYEYIEIAIKLSKRHDLLDELNASLRERMKHFGLVDEQRFTKELEHNYRNIWRTWSTRKKREWKLEHSLKLKGGYTCIHDGTFTTPFHWDLLVDEDCTERESKFVKKFVQSGDNCIDVGGGEGLYTLFAAVGAGELGKVAVIEPNSILAEFIEKNINNQLLANTLIFHDVDKNKLSEYLGGTCSYLRINVTSGIVEIVNELGLFLHGIGPLIQVNVPGIKRDIMSIISAFSEIGYLAYCYSPGLEILAPYEEACHEIDSLQNIFFCTSEKAQMLFERRLIAINIEELPDPTYTLDDLLQQYILFYPYLDELKEFISFKNNSTEERYYTALALYYVAHHKENFSSSQAYSALYKAWNMLNEIPEENMTFLRLCSFARISWELGKSKVAIEQLERLSVLLKERNEIDIYELFLLPGEKFESGAQGRDKFDWISCSVTHQLIELEYISTWFANEQVLEKLVALDARDWLSPKMERLKQLLEMRYGKRNKMFPSTSLVYASYENLNSKFWMER